MIILILRKFGNFTKNSLAKLATIIIFIISMIVFASRSLRLFVKIVFISVRRLSYLGVTVKEEGQLRSKLIPALGDRKERLIDAGVEQSH